MQKIQIGTSGFYYDHWIGKCYPEGISKRDLLPFYAGQFKTVEINSTFYHLPRQSTIAHWLEVTPEDFRFTLKANRSITHVKKLASARTEVLGFLHLVKPLKPKLGVILFQLPPQLRMDLKLLDDFIAGLPFGYRYAFEFRHGSWVSDLVLELLSLNKMGFCINDFDRKQTPWEATAPFAYIRMHGPLGRYRGRYGEEALEALCEKITAFAKEDKEVFCYFNNDMEGFAWENAKTLEALCEKRGMR
jgi:uncharacterized protein YecE (DUF72 family)